MTRHGQLHVVVGPMFSGKSTALIARLEQAHRLGWRIRAFRPTRDTRDEELRLVTHTGIRWPATRLPFAEALLDQVDDNVQLIAIDEVNMLAGDVVDVCQTLLIRGHDMVVAGLNLDYLGRPFEPIPTLMAYADEISTCTARCQRCHAPARFSHRLTHSQDLIAPGGSDAYEPRCLPCFKKGRETTAIDPPVVASESRH